MSTDLDRTRNTELENVETEMRRRMVAQILVRRPGITQRAIQQMLAAPVSEGGLRNSRTGKPYSIYTINNDIQELRKQYRASAMQDTDEWVGRALAAYDQLEADAWAKGDRNFIRKIWLDRRSLLGLDAPKKIAATTPDGLESAPLTSIQIIEHLNIEAPREKTPIDYVEIEGKYRDDDEYGDDS